MKINDIINEGKQLNEGILDYLKNLLFKKKEQEPAYVPITTEQRNMINAVFANSNAFIKWTPDGDYVLPTNVHTSHGTGAIAFYSLDGQLMAMVAHYRRPRFNIQKDTPLTHTDHKIDSINDLRKLRDMLNASH